MKICNLALLVSKNCVDSNKLDKKIIFKILKGKVFDKILDTGCGSGDFTIKIGKLVKAKEIHGIEIEDTSLFFMI